MVGELEIVENHLTTCGHVYESCQLLCGVVTTRDEMGRHVRKECSQREEACLHCSGVHKVCEMVEHVKVCGKVFVFCELGCGTRVLRESILFHLSSECSEESVVCPYEKYRCEVVGLKRQELKQHLEENRFLHTELKLAVFDEKFEISMNKIELLEKKVESLENELKMKVKEIEMLTDVLARHEGKVKWTISDFVKKFQPNLSRIYSNYYIITMWSEVINCHRNIKNSLIFKSPLIVISKQLFAWSRYKIALISLSTDLKEFIKSDNLELEVTVRILKNI